MDTTLQTFLTELAVDSGKLAEFRRDRQSYLERFSLPADVREAVIAGDERRIAELAGKKKKKHHQPNKAPNKAPSKAPMKTSRIPKKKTSKKTTVRKKPTPKR